MIKFVMNLTRHPKMNREEFKKYWEQNHAPLFLKNAEKLGAKKYVQSLTIDSSLNQGLRESRGMLSEFDGVAEVWFESELALIEGMSSPEGQEIAAALQTDENNFIDHSKSAAYIVQEQVML